MGAALAATHPQIAEVFEEASDALGLDLTALCAEQPASRLHQTVHAQPALVACSVATWRVLASELGTLPVMGAGHSVGELSALACAGVFTLSDAVRLARRRGELMQEAAPLGFGGMAAVFGLSAERVEAGCAELSARGFRVWLANHNAAEQTVISGEAAALKEACALLRKAGGVAHPLAVSIPAHTPLMQAAADRYAAELEQVHIAEGLWPVISNRSVQPYTTATVRENLVVQLTHPVQWLRTLTLLGKQRLDAVIEVGPKAVLRDLVRLESPGQLCFAVGEPAGLDALLGYVKKHASAPPEAPLKEWGQFLTRCLMAAVGARNHNTDPAKFAVGVVEPYRKLEALRRAEVELGKPCGPTEIRQGAELLKQILRTKRLPLAERTARLSELFAITRTSSLMPDFEP